MTPPELPAYEWRGCYYVWCDHCGKYHQHGAVDGPRVAHCADPASPYKATGYTLVHRGEFRRDPTRRRSPMPERWIG